MEQERKFQVDELTLQTGQLIMLPDPPVMVTQPTLYTLGLLGQANFYTAAVLLAFPKRVVKMNAEMAAFPLTDFDILMQVMRAQDTASLINARLALMLLSMLFPQYELKIAGNMILLNKIDDNTQVILNSDNYDYLRQVIIQIFKLEEIAGGDTSIKNEDGPMVRRIKEKLRKRHETLSKRKKGGKMDILSRYMSIVSVALGVPITDIKQYTVYMLFDNYKRGQLRDEFDLYIKRATSFGGVKKGEKVENWQKDLDEPPDS